MKNQPAGKLVDDVPFSPVLACIAFTLRDDGTPDAELLAENSAQSAPRELGEMNFTFLADRTPASQPLLDKEYTDGTSCERSVAMISMNVSLKAFSN